MSTRCFVLTLGVCSAVLAGCATDAQRRAQSLRSQIGAVMSTSRKCTDAVNAEPKYAPRFVHVPRPGASPTMEQLADTSYATPSEILLEEAHHDAILPCRDAAVAQLGNADNRFALVLSSAFNDSDAIILSLVQKKLTWGDANRQNQQLVLATGQKLRSVGGEIDSELQQENEAELAHRAQVAQAISQALGAAAQAAEAAQAARPIVTTCSGSANYASCVTRQ